MRFFAVHVDQPTGLGQATHVATPTAAPSPDIHGSNDIAPQERDEFQDYSAS